MTLLLLQDTLQKEQHHEPKNWDWLEDDRHVWDARLPFGDYMLVDKEELGPRGSGSIDVHARFGWVSFTPSVSIDTKKDLNEICGNLTVEHKRFSAECKKAQAHGCMLVILIENTDGITTIEDFSQWTEPDWSVKKRHGRKAHVGSSLAQSMCTMSDRYGVRWAFCTPEEAGRKVWEILERGREWTGSRRSSEQPSITQAVE